LAYARRLRHRAGPVGDSWHLDELFVTIRGQRQYLWRAVDQADRVGSYRAAHGVIMPSVVHDKPLRQQSGRVSHQPTRQRERHMRRFKSVGQAQRFLAVHDVVRNLLTVGRHRLRAGHQRLLRSRAFIAWNTAAAA
jgi:putative transposase